MQSNVVISILSGCGLWFTYSLICQRYEKFRNTLYYILLATAVAIGAHQIVSFSERKFLKENINLFCQTNHGQRLRFEITIYG